MVINNKSKKNNRNMVYKVDGARTGASIVAASEVIRRIMRRRANRRNL
jgi:hypothetical protein